MCIDEIDSLVGDTLISVLRQLRVGYSTRPKHFPESICLVGVRDVRDYRIRSDENQQYLLGGSAFNIKAESLLLPNFSKEEVRALYAQHTDQTGQQITNDAIEYAYEQTQGQPWLVNALAYHATSRLVTDRSQPITKEIMMQVRDHLILRRDTPIDGLAARLDEERVRPVIDAIIAGTTAPQSFPEDDIRYAIDVGLIVRREGQLCIANPIYQEIFPRELISSTQDTITQKIIWYQNSDGSLNMHALLEAFTQFYRENSAIWLEKFAYKESGPHLLMMAFLQRVINGGGKIQREYALGTRRVDLLIIFKQQRIVVELKMNHNPRYVEEGLHQTAQYMDTVAATEGHLIVFDSVDRPWDEKIYHREEQVAGKKVMIWGM